MEELELEYDIAFVNISKNKKTIEVGIETDLGLYIGVTNLHPEDEGIYSENTGVLYAEIRAALKYIHRRMILESWTLLDMKHRLQVYCNPDKKGLPYAKIKRKIAQAAYDNQNQIVSNITLIKKTLLKNLYKDIESRPQQVADFNRRLKVIRERKEAKEES